MSNDLNAAVVVGTVIRVEDMKRGTEIVGKRVALGALEPVVRDGKTVNIPVYINVEVPGLDGTECRAQVGDPYVAQGVFRQRSWRDPQDRYVEAFSVRAQNFKPLHGVSPDRVKYDPSGNPMLVGGYAHATILGRVSKEPEYKIAGNQPLLEIPLVTTEQWGDKDDQKHDNWHKLKMWREFADQLSALNPGKGTTLLGTYRIEGEKPYTNKHGVKCYPVVLSPIALPLIVGRREDRPSADGAPASVPTYGGYAPGDDYFAGAPVEPEGAAF